tara:strand:- start:953 stop:1162 length:210 start_codon:yes stop_codon:yes gene_type:complete
MIQFIKNLFGSEKEKISAPMVKDKELENPFDNVRISVLRSDYEELKRQLLKCQTTIRNQKKKIASLKKK